MDLKKLCEPFPADDVEWRIGRSGKGDKGYWATCLAYLTNRAIMQRLDDVCGPASWKNEHPTVGPAGGVVQGISIKLDGEWITKWDGAENTDIESVKGGLSDAMKRAGVLWGIGRYLYNLDEGFAECSDVKQNGYRYAKTKDGVMYWKPPLLPAWALPPKLNLIDEPLRKWMAWLKKEPTLEAFNDGLKELAEMDKPLKEAVWKASLEYAMNHNWVLDKAAKQFRSIA